MYTEDLTRSELARRRPADAAQPDAGPAVPAGRTTSAQSGGFPAHLSEFVSDEIAAALSLTAQTASRCLDLALDLATRLPGTARALRQGVIDYARARLISELTNILSDRDAATVEARVLPAAAHQTTGRLRATLARAVLATDPDAAARRREQALKDPRVRRWQEDAGSAALAGYGLPPADVLAADQQLTSRALDLRAAGVKASLDELRARAYLDALLGRDPAPLTTSAHAQPAPATVTPGGPAPGTGEAPAAYPPAPVPGTGEAPAVYPTVSVSGTGEAPAVYPTAPAPAPPAHNGVTPGAPASRPSPHDQPAPDGSDDSAAATSGLAAAPPDRPASAGLPAAASARGDPPGGVRLAARVNLTIPLTTLLGLANGPAEVGGFGPVDPALARDLASAAGAHPATRWCLTVTDQAGRALGHGCAPGQQPATILTSHIHTHMAGRNDSGPTPRTGAAATNQATSQPASQPTSQGATGPTRRTGPVLTGRRTTATTRGPTRSDSFTVTITALARHHCDHRHQEPGYQPSRALQHLIQARNTTCTAPGCTRPATACDLDHTLPYDHGGRTCECDLAPQCRHHHRCKQAPGWSLDQPAPGTLIWRTPAGRTYTTTPTIYPDDAA